MGLAFLMTGPSGDQISNYQGIIGAHTVGIADGGPGLPLLGWSTVSGDLRIPHFVGMHAMQVLPIVVVLLELASRRFDRLRDVGTRLRIMAVVVALYVAVLTIFMVQALRGESIVHPDGLIVSVTVGMVVASVIAVVIVLRRSGPSSPRPNCG